MSRLITISGAAGAGKTTVARLLADRFSFASLIMFDEHEDKVVFPETYPGAMPEEFDLSALASFIETEKNGVPDLVVFDYPFGRMNRTINPFIDLAVFLDVPLDVSMARRTRRVMKRNTPSDNEWLVSQLECWENGAREFCISWEKSVAESCDLVIDAMNSPGMIADEIIEHIMVMNSDGGRYTEYH